MEMHLLFAPTCMPLYTASMSAKNRKRQIASWRARRTENKSRERAAFVALVMRGVGDQTL